MKRWLSLILSLSGGAPICAAGLIVVGDNDFWQSASPRPDRRDSELVGRPPPRPRVEPARPIEISFTKADVKVKDQIATTEIEQEFFNPSSRQVEGTFLFPVPRGAGIDKFTMEIDGRAVEAELLAAGKARAVYEDIVRRLLDPALLEYCGRDLIRVRLFPIEARARKRITFSYSQILKADSGLVSFVLPLDTGKFSAKPGNVTVKVELESKHSLNSIYSPTHNIDLKRHGSHRATIAFEARGARADADFRLFYSQDDADFGVNLISFKNPGEDGYFLLLATPALAARDKVIPKDVVFVLDTSGSMAGAKLAQAKKALAFCVENLNDEDRFEILRFATEVEPLFEKLAEASPEQRATAQKFIAGLKPIGGTAIDAALKRAVALRPEKSVRPYVVIFLTDGRPTVGDINETHIVEHAVASKTTGSRFFCFGIGTDVNTHLLDRIAEETQAFSQYVLPEEDIEVKVSNFFTKIKEPVLASPKLIFPPPIRVTKLYPSPLPDLFKGQQVIVAGRYAGSGAGKIRISGQVNGVTKRFAYDVSFPAEETEHEFVPRLWATRRVGFLLDEIRLRGETAELKEEVAELARRYGIVTPYTAFLIHEDERRREVPLSMQSMPQLNEVRLRREAGGVYEAFKDKKDGDLGVAGSRSFQMLKTAESAEAIVSGNVEVLRVAPSAVSSAAAPGTSKSIGSRNRPDEGAQAGSHLSAAKQYEQQSQFVGGRTFFQNGDQWIDAGLQRKGDARHVRLQFGSDEYFTFLRNHPIARGWLALGKNVQFALGEAVYEIYE